VPGKKQAVAELRRHFAKKPKRQWSVKNRQTEKCPGIRLKAIVGRIVFHVRVNTVTSMHGHRDPEIPQMILTPIRALCEPGFDPNLLTKRPDLRSL